MRMIVTADLHLTWGRPLEEYRWGIFDALHKAAQSYDAKHVFILGDLTDAKDKHSAPLVNRLVEALHWLGEAFKVHILAGNHDYLDHHMPFFKFVNIVGNQIHFYDKPTYLFTEDSNPLLVVPHCTNFPAVLKKYMRKKIRLVFMHQTITGAKASETYKLEGIDTAVIRKYRYARFISGDVHVRQDMCIKDGVASLRYVGAPYHVHFGDEYDGGFFGIKYERDTLAIQRTKPTTTFPKRVMKHVTAESILQSRPTVVSWGIEEGSQIKVVVHMDTGNVLHWARIKDLVHETCEINKLVLADLSFEIEQSVSSGRLKVAQFVPVPSELYRQYCKAHGIGKEMQRVGEGYFAPRD